MTIIPPGAQLAPIDLPPPHPSVDPREPSPSTSVARPRGSRTPQRHRSPRSSRASSPNPVSPSSTTSPIEGGANLASGASTLASTSTPPPPLFHPRPNATSSAPISPTAATAPNVCSGSVPLFGSTGHANATLGATSTSHHHHHHHHHSYLGHHLSRPGSPASIHSSSSAIFERDIELPAVASLSLNPNQPPIQPNATLNHKPSRIFSHGSALEHTVPAVLDDAVEALSQSGADGIGNIDRLEIEAPAPAAIGMVRQSSSSLPGMPAVNPSGSTLRKLHSSPGHSASRSPSPISVVSGSGSPIASPPTSPPILSQLAMQQAQAQAAIQTASTPPPISANSSSAPQVPQARHSSPSQSPQRPTLGQRISTGPLLPGGWAFGGRSETLAEESKDDASMPTSGLPPPHAVPTHLTPTKEKRRISFISYNDLLLSVPTTVTSLGEIASGNLSPDHLPGTVSPGIVSRSPVAPSSTFVGSGNGQNLVVGTTGTLGASLAGASGVGISGSGTGPGGGGALTLDGAGQHANLLNNAHWEATGRGGLGLGGDEWEREGLGKGLEQRLEDLVQQSTPRD